MAELGNIDIAPVTVGDDEGRGGNVINRGISQLGGVVAEAVTEDILGDFKEKADDIVDKQVGAGSASEEIVLPLPMGDPVADAFRNNMVRLRASAIQGNSAQRALAELEIKRELNKMTSRFPSLRAELNQEYSQFARTDAGLDELGMRDVGLAAGAKAAAKDRARIEDFAYRKVKDGGLGILPSIPSDGAVFALEFLEGAKEYQAIQFNALYAASDSARNNIDARAMRENWQRTLVGSTSAIHASIEGVIDQARTVTRARQNIGFGGNRDLINDWEMGGKENAKTAIEGQIVALEAGFAQINVGLRQTDDYKEIEKLKNDAVTHLTRFMTAIDSEAPHAMEAWDIEQQLRRAALREANPDMDNALLFVETNDKIIEHWETLGGEDINLQDELGLMMQNAVGPYLKRVYVNGGQGVVTDTDSPRQRKNHLLMNLRANNRPYGAADTSDEALLKGATISMDQHRINFGQVSEHSSAPAMARHFNNMATDLLVQDMATGNIQDKQVSRTLKRTLSSDNVTTAIKHARKDPAAHIAMRTAGNAAFEVWNTNDPEDPHLKELVTEFRASFGGEPLSNVLVAEFSKIGEGVITFSVDSSLITPLESRRSGINRDMSPRNLNTEAHEKAQALGALLTENLKAYANMMWMRNPEQDAPDYETAYISAGFAGVIPVGPGLEVQ